MVKPARVAPFSGDALAAPSTSRLFTEDRRLRILQWICRSPGYTVNHAVLSQLLAESGHVVSEDRLRTDLSWLAEQELIELDAGVLYVVRLNERGRNVVDGRAVVPGVNRPLPGE